MNKKIFYFDILKISFKVSLKVRPTTLPMQLKIRGLIISIISATAINESR